MSPFFSYHWKVPLCKNVLSWFPPNVICHGILYFIFLNILLVVWARGWRNSREDTTCVSSVRLFVLFLCTFVLLELHKSEIMKHPSVWAEPCKTNFFHIGKATVRTQKIFLKIATCGLFKNGLIFLSNFLCVPVFPWTLFSVSTFDLHYDGWWDNKTNFVLFLLHLSISFFFCSPGIVRIGILEILLLSHRFLQFHSFFFWSIFVVFVQIG